MPQYKVLLVNAIDPLQDTDTYPPLGIGYLVSSLRNRFGHDSIECEIVEKNVESAIKTFNPNIICISSVTPNYNWAIKYARLAKEYKLPVIIGGVHISMLPHSLTENMDIGVIGEGEETICKLFDLYNKGEMFNELALQNVEGIVYRKKEGNFQITSKRALIRPLDSILAPSRDLMTIESHTYMFTGRGCPYQCVFCSSARYWDKVRLNSADYVVNEIEQLVESYNVSSIYFCDDIFILKVQRIEQIIKLLEERGLLGKISFTCACRSNLVNEKVIALLKKLGVTHITMGFESGSDKILKYLKASQTSIKTHENAIKIIRKYGIEVMGNFIIGSPQEKKEDIEETIDFIKRNELINGGIFPLTPLPGTPIWDYAQEKGMVSDDMDWDLLAFSEFQYNSASSVHLSENLTRKELYDYIQLFKRWRRRYVLKSFIIKSLSNPLKLPGVTFSLIKMIMRKIKLILLKVKVPNGIRAHKL